MTTLARAVLGAVVAFVAACRAFDDPVLPPE